MNYSSFMRIRLISILLIGLFSCQISQANITSEINQYCPDCEQLSSESTATVILDKGETALLSRAWLTLFLGSGCIGLAIGGILVITLASALDRYGAIILLKLSKNLTST